MPENKNLAFSSAAVWELANKKQVIGTHVSQTKQPASHSQLTRKYDQFCLMMLHARLHEAMATKKGIAWSTTSIHVWSSFLIQLARQPSRKHTFLSSCMNTFGQLMQMLGQATSLAWFPNSSNWQDTWILQKHKVNGLSATPPQSASLFNWRRRAPPPQAAACQKKGSFSRKTKFLSWSSVQEPITPIRKKNKKKW